MRLNRTSNKQSNSHYRCFKIRFCDRTFQTHFKKRMSLCGYQNALSYVCPCVSLHTDNIEKRFRKQLFISLSYGTISLLQVVLREVLFVLNVLEQYVLSGNYNAQRNQEGTDSSALGNITDISHSPLNRFFYMKPVDGWMEG
jgi:hypothetical protein